MFKERRGHVFFEMAVTRTSKLDERVTLKSIAYFTFSIIIYHTTYLGLVWLCRPWILRSSDGISHFSGIFPLAQGGLNPLQPGSWSSRLPGIREGSYGQFNPNTT